ncbi:hypothetical protein [Dyella acidisoli]|uniref:DUF3899 domain-containing protein n=1 Tax=Dyella acidisoli TaxID=1867834 RepID=A0ABQ5XRT7_9GAMM|nr:hypothetical protein [Dyella acidisoli]GLQ94466.1 hypothetical protein GCM10007901_34180 [Dyella acidisoli]
MATLKEASQRLDLLSTQISTQVRTVALGVLAVAWLFISGSKDSPTLLAKISEWELVTIAFLSLLALAFDLLQYFVGYFVDYRAYKKARALKNADNPSPTVKFPKNPLRHFFFYTKQMLAIVAAGWLAVACILAIFVK